MNSDIKKIACLLIICLFCSCTKFEIGPKDSIDGEYYLIRYDWLGLSPDLDGDGISDSELLNKFIDWNGGNEFKLYVMARNSSIYQGYVNAAVPLMKEGGGPRCVWRYVTAKYTKDNTSVYFLDDTFRISPPEDGSRMTLSKPSMQFNDNEHGIKTIRLTCAVSAYDYRTDSIMNGKVLLQYVAGQNVTVSHGTIFVEE